MNKTDNLIQNSPIFVSIPDILVNICAKLDIRSLIQFERTHKWTGETKAAWHQTIWHQRRSERDYAFEWSFLAKEEQKDKWAYTLNSALKTYVMEDRVRIMYDLLEQKKECLKKVTKKLDHLMRRFPLFGGYVKQDIYLMEHKTTLESNELIKQKESFLSQIGKNEYGGDLLLAGLWELISMPLPDSKNEDEINQKHNVICDCFERAIEKQATIASIALLECARLGWGISPEPKPRKSTRTRLDFYASNPLYMRSAYSIALAAAKQRDYRGIDACLELNSSFESILSSLQKKASHSFPPFKNKALNRELTKLKQGKPESVEWKELDKKYQELLHQYEGQASVLALVNAAFIKTRLEQWQEADSLYSSALELYYNGRVSFPIASLLEAAKVKIKLKLWEEANCLLTKRLSVTLYSQDIPPTDWYLSTHGRDLLSEIDELYDVCLGAIKRNTSLYVDMVVIQAYVKRGLGQWEKADELFVLYLKDLEARKEPIPSEILVVAAHIKIKLNCWPEASAFYLAYNKGNLKNTPKHILKLAEEVERQLREHHFLINANSSSDSCVLI